MENFVAFLRDNWKFLLEILVPLVSLVVLCFVRKVKVNIPDVLLTELMVNIPLWIVDAEKDIGAGNGDMKMKYVFKKAIDYLCTNLGLTTADAIRVYGHQVVQSIENILETPQKKGDQ